MNNIRNLLDRIDAETVVVEKRIRNVQQQGESLFEERKSRYQQHFLPALERLKGIWDARLKVLGDKFQALAREFGDAVKVTPVIKPSPDEPHSGEMAFTCESSLARIRLQFSFFHDVDIRNLLIDYDLEIIPVFLKFEPHARLEQPLEAMDEDALAQWLDDRIVDFVRTYLAIHQNSYYLGDRMVEDPVVKVRFPSYAARATLKSDGHTLFFISPETKQEFLKQPTRSEPKLKKEEFCHGT